MAFTWPPRTQYKTKERISQILWTLKQEGDIEDKGCAIRVLMDRMRAHGVPIDKSDEPAIRLTIVEISGGKFGDLILRDVKGRRTQGLYLLLENMEDLPTNYLPDVVDDDDEAYQAALPLEPAPTPASEPAPVIVPEPEPAVIVPDPVVPAEPDPAPVLAKAAARPRLVAVPAAPESDDEFDLIIAGLEAELEDLRATPLPEPVPVATVLERVDAADLTDKAGVMNAILHLVGDLAVMVAGEPTAIENDIDLKDRLAETIEQAQRYRRRATEAGETALARAKENDALKRQIAERDRRIARMEANLEAMQNGERVENTAAARQGLKFVSERPHHRRGASEDSSLVYSVG